MQPSTKDKNWQKHGRNGGDQKEKGKMGENSSDSATNDKFPPCSICKRTNHLAKDCWYKGKPQIQCYHCKKWGHREMFCKAKQNQAQQQQAHYANITNEKPQSEDHLFMAFNEQSQAEEQLFMAAQTCHSAPKDVWCVDSGCTNHMAKDESLLTSLDGAVRSRVKLGNGEAREEVQFMFTLIKI